MGLLSDPCDDSRLVRRETGTDRSNGGGCLQSDAHPGTEAGPPVVLTSPFLSVARGVAALSLVTHPSGVIPFRRMFHSRLPVPGCSTQHGGASHEPQSTSSPNASGLAVRAGTPQYQCGGDRLRISRAFRRGAARSCCHTGAVVQDLYERPASAGRLAHGVPREERRDGGLLRLVQHKTLTLTLQADIHG